MGNLFSCLRKSSVSVDPVIDPAPVSAGSSNDEESTESYETLVGIMNARSQNIVASSFADAQSMEMDPGSAVKRPKNPSPPEHRKNSKEKTGRKVSKLVSA